MNNASFAPLDAAETSKATNVGKADTLKDDPALAAFLSKEVKNDSKVFRDYAPTRALVRAAINDALDTLGIQK